MLVASHVVHSGLMNRLVVAVLVVVGVRGTNLLGVSVVVASLGNDVMLLRASDSEVERLVLLILVVVGVILVAVHVLRGHVMVARVLVVVRRVGVSLMVLVVGRVITFVMSSLVGNLVVGCGCVVHSLCLMMDNSSLMVSDRLVLSQGCQMRRLVMDRLDLMMHRGCVMNGSSSVNWGGVVHGSLVMDNLFVVDWGGVHGSLVMDNLFVVDWGGVHGGSVVNWSSMHGHGVVHGSLMVHSLNLVMNGGSMVHGSCMDWGSVVHRSSMDWGGMVDRGSVLL